MMHVITHIVMSSLTHVSNMVTLTYSNSVNSLTVAFDPEVNSEVNSEVNLW